MIAHAQISIERNFSGYQPFSRCSPAHDNQMQAMPLFTPKIQVAMAASRIKAVIMRVINRFYVWFGR
jgi:hypothetical protein